MSEQIIEVGFDRSSKTGETVFSWLVIQLTR
jgi:hypothetical protein